MFSPYMEDIFTRAQQDGVIPVTPVRLPEHGRPFLKAVKRFQMNMVYAFGFDCTDVFDLTKAEIAGRQQALWAIDALRHYVPGFENVRLRNFGATLGTRITAY